MPRPLLEGTDVARSLGGLRVLTRADFAVSEGGLLRRRHRPLATGRSPRL
jgi:hypothetical protein